MTHGGDAARTVARIRESYRYVDYVVVAAADCTDEQLESFKIAPNVVVVRFEWHDNFPEGRNVYIQRAKELDADWVVVSDPDEGFNERFWTDIKENVKLAERRGINMLAVNAHDAFETFEWLDELDRVQQVPSGYRSGDFYKQLVFKLYPDLKYEGVGVTKAVHETWHGSVPWKSARLPKDTIWYTHTKSALDVWRNAARNLFAGGGGDNVGEVNPLWKPLREITDSLGLKKWKDVREYVESGGKREGLNPELIAWVKKALTFSATNWGTECREFGKWGVYYNRYLLSDQEVEFGLANPPKMTPEIEAENYVILCYFQVLGRHPDVEGKNSYTKAILEGRIKKEQLPQILMQSEEYAQKRFPEKIRVEVPVNVDVLLNDELFMQAFMRSTYWTETQKRIDLAKFIETFASKDGFYDVFYRRKNLGTLKTLGQFVELLKAKTHLGEGKEIQTEKQDVVTLCILAYNEDRMLDACLNYHQRFFKHIVVLDGYSTDKTVDVAKKHGVNLVQERFGGSFADMRNFLSRQAPTDWVLHVDCDELFDWSFLRRIEEYTRLGVSAFRFKRLNIEPLDPNPEDYHIRLYNKKAAKWKRDLHEILVDLETEATIDSIEGKWQALDDLPIIHVLKDEQARIDRWKQWEALSEAKV